MRFPLQEVVLWGRILGCGAGPASFKCGGDTLLRVTPRPANLMQGV